jgi:hypothetical protein
LAAAGLAAAGSTERSGTLASPHGFPLTEFGLLPEPVAIDAYPRRGRVEEERALHYRRIRPFRPGPAAGVVRERLMAEAYLVENTSSIIPYVRENASQGKGGSCSGDSGGPVVLQGHPAHPAVISIGMNPQCKGLDFSYRLDRPQVLARIRDPTGPTPAEPAFAVQPPRMAVRQRRMSCMTAHARQSG